MNKLFLYIQILNRRILLKVPTLLVVVTIINIVNPSVTKAIIPTTERIAKCQKILNGNINQADVGELEKCERILNTKVKETSQRKTLYNNQYRLYSLKVDTAERDLNNIQKEYERNQLELKKLEKELEKKDKEIKQFKEQLKKNLVVYQQNDDNFKIKILSSKNDITSLLNQSEYLRRLFEEINEKIATIKNDKKEIEIKKQKIEESKEKIEDNKKDLLKKKEALEQQKRIKKDFLIKTQGDENKYKALLAHIEEQKKKLFNFSAVSSATKESVKEIQRNAKKPKSGLASTSWYYAQDDNKWGNKTIGFSKTLMKDYGCAVTALSMVFTKNGEKINPGKLAKKPLFYRDLIVWPNTWGKLKLTSGRNHGNISWKTIDKKLKKKIPVVVFIRSRSGAGHYVVIHHKDKNGKYVVHDPLFGANIYLETSKKLISSIYKSGVVVDQMIIYE